MSRRLLEEVYGVVGSRRVIRDDVDCCGLREILEDMSAEVGVDSRRLYEAMKCDEDCKSRYMEDGKFKGGKGQAFKSCVSMFSNCCKGVTDPERLCAYIGRRSGKSSSPGG